MFCSKIKDIIGITIAKKLLPYADHVRREKDLYCLHNINHIGSNCYVGNNPRVTGGQYVNVGNNVHIGHFIRLEAIDRYSKHSYSPHVVIDDYVSMQDYCHIGCVESVEIGAGTMIASHVYISDHNHGSILSDDVLFKPADRPLTHKPIKIGRNVWIGEGVCVLPGVELGDNVIVGANAVVTKSFPANSVIAGVPAKLLKLI